MSSLSARLLISVFILLLFFFGATIIALDIAFRDAGEKAQEDILDGQMLALLAAAELNADGDLEMPLSLREPRFGNLGSGLYADLQDFDGNHQRLRFRPVPFIAILERVSELSGPKDGVKLRPYELSSVLLILAIQPNRDLGRRSSRNRKTAEENFTVVARQCRQLQFQASLLRSWR